MCVVCFLLCQAFGFGKENEDAGETRGNKEKEEEKKESVVGQSYVDSSVISGQIIRWTMKTTTSIRKKIDR